MIQLDSTRIQVSVAPRSSSAIATPSRAGVFRPELLAPAGNWDCARAAVENGADAIYFGLDRFNARMRADNFTVADLPELMAFLHRRGVRGYVTFNILVFTGELNDAEDYLRSLITAGVDAAIVQDVGLCRLIRRLSPDFPIYASTQMTITSAAGLEFARALGCSLVALARECSVKEISQIQTERAAVAQAFKSVPDQSGAVFPLEVFIHGALCVAYSGQCLISEALGGRSANRGECAQACRLPYELICDGQTVPLGDRKYLLSPQDLAGIEVLPELIGADVTSLKIEGRLKSPEYVANITRLYRKAIDQLTGPDRPADDAGAGALIARLQSESRYDMEMAFSRGLYSGWLRGVNNQRLVHARFGKKRGVFLGEVRRLLSESVSIKLEAPLKPGDGIVFDAGHPEQPEEGGRVYTVEGQGAESKLYFGHGDIDFSRVHTGDKIWKTSDPELERRLRQTFAGEQPHFTRPVQITVRGQAGEPMLVELADAEGRSVQAPSAMPLVRAEKQPLETERLRAQLGRLGGTPFHLAELHNYLAGPVMLPVSELNRLRRELAASLDALRARPLPWTRHPKPETGSFVEAMLMEIQDDTRNPDKKAASAADPLPRARTLQPSTFNLQPPVAPLPAPELVVLVRNLSQLEAALRCDTRTFYCEFEDPMKYRDAVHMVRCADGCGEAADDPGRESARAIWVAPPRIAKPGEDWILQQVRSCHADGYLIRNFDHLVFFAGQRCIADYSFNIANPLSAAYFKQRFNLERLTASYDLNFDQLDGLLRGSSPAWFEVTVQQHLPMFHMEHCVFCAFLSDGTDHTNCGRPCEKHVVELRDRVGAAHPVLADAGCRNTVFHARAQTGAEAVPHLCQLGIGALRLEFLNEPPDQVALTIGKYRQLLRGEITGAQLVRELKLWNQLGITSFQERKPAKYGSAK